MNDLDEGVNIGSAIEIGSSIEPSTAYVAVPYDPSKARENVRGTVALLLIGLMTATVLASFILLWIHPDRSKELHDLLALVFGPIVALVGAATGYYFGTQTANKS